MDLNVQFCFHLYDFECDHFEFSNILIYDFQQKETDNSHVKKLIQKLNSESYVISDIRDLTQSFSLPMLSKTLHSEGSASDGEKLIIEKLLGIKIIMLWHFNILLHWSPSW